MTLCPVHATTENIDEIVQDHDNFGIDETEDDNSLDSVSNSASAMVVNDEAMASMPSHKIGGYKRKCEMLEKSSRFDETMMMMIEAKKKREAFSSEQQEQEVCVASGSSSEVILASEAEQRECPFEEVVTAKEPPKGLEPWLDTFSSWSHAQRLDAIDQLINRYAFF